MVAGSEDEEMSAADAVANRTMVSLQPRTPPGAAVDAADARDLDARDSVAGLIRFLGEDTRREGLVRTPQRVVKALSFLTSGYQKSVAGVINGAIFAEEYSEMVLVRDIELYSLCEHHLLPFFGRAHVAYIPDGRIIGLSKLPRLVEMFSRRLQTQERLTVQVAEALEGALRPLGVAVVVEASHLCVMMRGVQKQNSQTVTSSMRGSFMTDPSTRAELMDLLRGGPGRPSSGLSTGIGGC
jgi:GTP cyclohydrolase IA